MGENIKRITPILLMITLLLAGCTTEEYYLSGSSTSYSNIALSANIETSNNATNINCTTNNPSNADMTYNGTTWTLGCFNYRTDICTTFQTENITTYTGTGANANTIMYTEWNTTWGTMCCNPNGALCVPANFNNTWHTCEGIIYEEITPFITYNQSSNKWEGITCTKGIL